MLLPRLRQFAGVTRLAQPSCPACCGAFAKREAHSRRTKEYGEGRTRVTSRIFSDPCCSNRLGSTLCWESKNSRNAARSKIRHEHGTAHRMFGVYQGIQSTGHPRRRFSRNSWSAKIPKNLSERRREAACIPRPSAADTAPPSELHALPLQPFPFNSTCAILRGSPLVGRSRPRWSTAS